jgi:Flp pilus assembly protein CpaB
MPDISDIQQEASSAGKKALAVFVLSVFIAATIGYMLAKLNQTTPDSHPVVVTTRNIASGEILSQGDLKEVSYNSIAIPDGSFDAINAVLAGDHITTTFLARGEPVLKTRLTANRGLEVNKKIEKGMRAYVTEVSSSLAYTQIVNPNSLVDVLAVSTVKHKNTEYSLVRLVLQCVKVIAIGDRIDLPPSRSSNNEVEGSGNNSQSIELHHIVTLLLSPEDIEKLVLAKKFGELELMLRNNKDTQKIDLKPLVFEQWMDKWGHEDNKKTNTPASGVTSSTPSTIRTPAVRAKRSRIKIKQSADGW